jgi:hypothetical protein
MRFGRSRIEAGNSVNSLQKVESHVRLARLPMSLAAW